MNAETETYLLGIYGFESSAIVGGRHGWTEQELEAGCLLMIDYDMFIRTVSRRAVE